MERNQSNVNLEGNKKRLGSPSQPRRSLRDAPVGGMRAPLVSVQGTPVLYLRARFRAHGEPRADGGMQRGAQEEGRAVSLSRHRAERTHRSGLEQPRTSTQRARAPPSRPRRNRDPGGGCGLDVAPAEASGAGMRTRAGHQNASDPAHSGAAVWEPHVMSCFELVAPPQASRCGKAPARAYCRHSRRRHHRIACSGR